MLALSWQAPQLSSALPMLPVRLLCLHHAPLHSVPRLWLFSVAFPEGLADRAGESHMQLKAARWSHFCPRNSSHLSTRTRTVLRRP